MAASNLTIKVGLDTTELLAKFELLHSVALEMSDQFRSIADACAEAIDATERLSEEAIPELMKMPGFVQ